MNAEQLIEIYLKPPKRKYRGYVPTARLKPPHKMKAQRIQQNPGKWEVNMYFDPKYVGTGQKELWLKLAVDSAGNIFMADTGEVVYMTPEDEWQFEYLLSARLR